MRIRKSELKRRCFTLFTGVVAGLLAAAGTTYAIPIEGNAIGEWVNPDHDGNDAWSFSGDDDGVAANSVHIFNWGYPDPSILAFDGVGSDDLDAQPGWTAEVGEAFQIGTIWYHNGINGSSTADGITGIDLSLQLEITNPDLGLTDQFTFEFGILNTPNRWWKIPDYVFEEDFFSDTTFEIDGGVYSLRLLGFGDSDGSQTDGYSDYLKSQEGRTRHAGLYAQIDQIAQRDPPSSVPESSVSTAFLLFGALISMSAFRRREHR
jgi:hypothetical protein